jgi:hypothetical protein
LNVEYLYLWLAGAAVALIISVVLVIRRWKAFSLPLRLIPVDVLTVILLIDLNIKSGNKVTVDDPVMKLEAIAFTALLTFVLFAPVVWKAAYSRKRVSSGKVAQ